MAIEIVSFFPLKMVIFHSYVSLPEGNYYGWWLHRISAIPQDAPQLWVVTGVTRKTILHGEEKEIIFFCIKISYFYC